VPQGANETDAPDHNRCYNFSAAPDFHRDDRVQPVASGLERTHEERQCLARLLNKIWAAQQFPVAAAHAESS